MKKKKIVMTIGFILLILCITIGYSLLSTTLNINGSSSINNARWDIHFENIQVKSGSVTPTSAATIASSNTVTYSVTFNTPGEFYEFTVDAKNGGSIDGMIESISSKVNNQNISNLPNYIEYSITYNDGTEIVENQLLSAGSKLTYKVHIGFKKDINPSDLPDEEETYNFELEINDIQADDSAVEIEQIDPNIVYTFNPYSPGVFVGESIDPNIIQYQTVSQVIQGSFSFNSNRSPAFLKHILSNGIVDESYVGFIVSDEMSSSCNMKKGTYYITTYNSREENIEIAQEAFNNSNCANHNDHYYCSNECLQVYIYADYNGNIAASDGYSECMMTNEGESYCGPAGISY